MVATFDKRNRKMRFVNDELEIERYDMLTMNLLNVDIKEMPLRLLKSAGNISTSRITAFLEFMY